MPYPDHSMALLGSLTSKKSAISFQRHLNIRSPLTHLSITNAKTLPEDLLVSFFSSLPHHGLLLIFMLRMKIRIAIENDLPGILEIYSEEVQSSTSTIDLPHSAVGKNAIAGYWLLGPVRYRPAPASTEHLGEKFDRNRSRKLREECG